MKSNRLMDYTLAIPGHLFSPYAVPFILGAIGFLYPNVEMELTHL